MIYKVCEETAKGIFLDILGSSGYNRPSTYSISALFCWHYHGSSECQEQGKLNKDAGIPIKHSTFINHRLNYHRSLGHIKDFHVFCPISKVPYTLKNFKIHRKVEMIPAGTLQR